MDKALITARIQQLEETQHGVEQQLRYLETKQSELRTTSLRISGALQVLKELLDEPEQNAVPDGGQA